MRNGSDSGLDNHTVNILMVDDREENLLALEAVLSTPQYRLVKASSGKAALKHMLQEDFVVIIMDIQMPDLDGFETAKMIRQREKTRDIPIIFMTALNQTNENILHGYSVGAIDFIIKPFDPFILRCKVEGFVALHLQQKKIEEQAKIIASRTKELEKANTALQINEEILEKQVVERTNELFLTNQKLQQEIDKNQAALFELKKSREFMQHTDKLTAVGELAAGIAHEIRNPLTSLKGFTQLLGSNLDSNQHYLDIMINEIERINSIVSELLLVAKPTKMDFKKIDLGNILYTVMTLMKAQANLFGVHIRLNSSVELNDCYILGIESKIKQVFINLLKNGIEAMENGGEILITITKENNQLVIKVKDEGSGIPSELISKIGQPFFTTKEKGTGLGIMVCYSIIEAHQGKMLIDSNKGKGTNVSIILPLS